MKQLIIIGARGFGREVFSLAKRSVGYNQEFVIKGFLDDKLDALSGFHNYPPILSSVEGYDIQSSDVFICALGSIKWKKIYSEIILSRGGIFINLIDKSVVLNDNILIGKGCIFCDHVIISNDTIIRDFVTIHPFSNFGHDIYIGNYTHIGAHCFVGGYTTVDDEVIIHVKSTILDRIKIEKNAIIGAGSVVVKNVRSGITVFGNPARKIEF
jgi:sugar O-acyltransferase (sialic acid O-acetyltransferase NeuD family)